MNMHTRLALLFSNKPNPRTRVRMTVLCLCILGVTSLAWPADPAKPLVRAHAHNDYEHDRPLLDALDHGFCSIEADIHEVDGALLVAHDADQCRPERTLQALYLDPLRERVRKYDGRVYPGGPSIILLIDLKTNGRSTCPVLFEVLEQYADILTEYRGDKTTERAVTVLLSGQRPPKRSFAQMPVRYAAIDGRPFDLKRNPPVNRVPFISAGWSSLFESGEDGVISDADLAKMDALIKQVHGQGRKIRFWAVPAGATHWPLLYEKGIDLLNADRLARLQAFLLKREPKTK